MYLGKRKTLEGSITDIAPVLLDRKMRRIYYDSMKASPNPDFLHFWSKILDRIHREYFSSASIQFKKLLEYMNVEGDSPMCIESILVSYLYLKLVILSEER